MSVAFSRNAEKIFPFCRLFIPAFSAWTVHFTDHRARVGALRPYELSWHRHLGLFFEIPVREGDGPVSHDSCMPSGLAGPVWEGVLTPILLAAMHPSSAVWCTGTFGGGYAEPGGPALSSRLATRSPVIILLFCPYCDAWRTYSTRLSDARLSQVSQKKTRKNR